jgi:acylphosphatase
MTANMVFRGWIRNTERRTVQGELEGSADQIAAMKLWLQTTGSPSSRIEKAVFKNEKPVEKYSFGDTFEVRR